MKENYFRNESGITLIELLATISIIAIISSLLWGALTVTFKQSERTEEHVNLRQEANMIVTKLRTMHLQGNYQLCYEGGKVYFDSGKKDSLASDGITIEGLHDSLNGDVLFENSGNIVKQNLPIDCNNMLNIDTSDPLSVTLKIKDQKNNTFEIDTVINKLPSTGVGNP